MKTTIEINDELLRQAKLKAQEEGSTLRELVEDGLRRVLTARAAPQAKPKIRVFVSKQPSGFAPGFDPYDIARMKELGRER